MSIIKKSLSDEREEQKAESSSRSICCYWSLSLDEISVLQCRYTNIGGKLSQEIFIVEVTAFFGDLSHAEGGRHEIILCLGGTGSNAVLMKAYAEAFFVMNTEGIYAVVLDYKLVVIEGYFRSGIDTVPE